jgi:uncharacterized membrane protein YdbT with pleckstrin-like domain
MASYVEKVISSGEEVIYQGKISLWALTPYYLIGLCLLPLYGLGLLIFFFAYLKYISTELAITNKKIIAKVGFIRRHTIELILHKVESIQVTQSLLGRLFNYGSIVVSGAGGPRAPIMGISKPIEFRKTFMEIQETSIK